VRRLSLALLISTGVILVLIVLGVIGYRAGWFISDNDRLGDTIRFALPAKDDTSDTVLDLDQLIDGEWDRLVITCYGMAFGEVRDALGQASTSDDAELQGATVMIYFIDGDRIEHTYNLDADILAEPVYFDPCVRERLDGDPVLEPILLDREHAQLSLVLDPDQYDPVWVLASAD